jgi:hypothetical protein
MGMGAGNGQRPFAILVQAVAGEALNGVSSMTDQEAGEIIQGIIHSYPSSNERSDLGVELKWENVSDCKPG